MLYFCYTHVTLPVKQLSVRYTAYAMTGSKAFWAFALLVFISSSTVSKMSIPALSCSYSCQLLITYS